MYRVIRHCSHTMKETESRFFRSQTKMSTTSTCFVSRTVVHWFLQCTVFRQPLHPPLPPVGKTRACTTNPVLHRGKNKQKKLHLMTRTFTWHWRAKPFDTTQSDWMSEMTVRVQYSTTTFSRKPARTVEKTASPGSIRHFLAVQSR